MKFYATIIASKLVNGKSVMVEKSQGSNEWLDIEVLNSDRMPIFRLKIEQHPEGCLVTENGRQYVQKKHGGGYYTKGNQQKGESLCTDGQPHRYVNGECTGPDCYKDQ